MKINSLQLISLASIMMIGMASCSGEKVSEEEKEKTEMMEKAAEDIQEVKTEVKESAKKAEEEIDKLLEDL